MSPLPSVQPANGAVTSSPASTRGMIPYASPISSSALPASTTSPLPINTPAAAQTPTDHIHANAPSSAPPPDRLPLELIRLILLLSAQTPSSSDDDAKALRTSATASTTASGSDKPRTAAAAGPTLDTLYTACLVDKAWSSLALPELYRHVLVNEANAVKALQTLWRCVVQVQAKGGPLGAVPVRRHDVEVAGRRRSMPVKTLELISLPDCSDVHLATIVPAIPRPEQSGEHIRASSFSARIREAGEHDPTVDLDQLVIHESALWTLCLAYTFDRHHRATHRNAPIDVRAATSSMMSSGSSALTDEAAAPSPYASPHAHPYLSLLTHVRPRRLVLHIPTSQRAAYLRRRSYIPICCGRPECRAALAKLWSAPVVPRDVVRDICETLWPGYERDMASVEIRGITDEQPPLLSFHRHQCDTAGEAGSDAETPCPGSYSITFSSCLCANPLYADDHCPNHVSIQRRAMQVAAVLDGRLGVRAGKDLARDVLDRIRSPTSSATDDVEEAAIVGEGCAAVATGEGQQQQPLPTGGSTEEDSAAAARRNTHSADVVISGEGFELELIDVGKVGWTYKAPREVDEAIWEQVYEMLQQGE